MASQKESKSYREMAGDYYNAKYESWMPWIEDKYLAWFTNDNKASYATKRSGPVIPSCAMRRVTDASIENLDKTKVTGIEPADKLQDGANSLLSSQIAPGGIAAPLGNAASKEGVNRAERGGKDEQGKALQDQGPLGGYGSSAMEGVKGGAQKVGGIFGGSGDAPSGKK